MKFTDKFKNFLQDESGQGTLEYVLLLSVVVLAAGAFSRGVLKMLDSGILTFGGQLEMDLKTGRTPVNAWKN